MSDCRIGFEQIAQTGVSLTLQHFSHKCNSVFNFINDCANTETSDSGRFSKYITKRNAVRFPIPGKPDNDSTAFSTIDDVNCTTAKIHQTLYVFDCDYIF